MPCVPGLANDKEGKTSCKKCLIKTFAANVGQLLCLDCPFGRTAAVGQAVCSRCGTGTYKLNDTCIDCPSGYHQDKQDQIRCLSCVPGYYGVSSALTLCLECNPGRYTLNNTQTECSACDVGRYSPKTCEATSHPRTHPIR